MKNVSSSTSQEKNTSDPSSRNYPKEMKNKANEKSPYGKAEPSTRTTFK